LRLLARANSLDFADERLLAAARETGADVPVCLDPCARLMGGIGEKLGPRLHLPALFCVLVNPAVAVETRAVFQALGLSPGERAVLRAPLDFEKISSAEVLIARLRDASNDMQRAASATEPAIPLVLQALEETRGVRLARMSGSGATCFAVYNSCREASRAASALRALHVAWWVKATVLR
jgi:4-diphosphocytidyl-2-C-methyl-D-erythritol kinase